MFRVFRGTQNLRSNRLSYQISKLSFILCMLAATPLLIASNTASANPGISFRSASSGHNSVANNLQLATPAGATSGDLLLASVDVIQSPTITVPSGWTLIRTDTSTASTRMSQSLYVHVVTASEPTSYTWRFSAADSASGGIVDYTGVDTANPVDVSSGQSSVKSTQIVAPSLTTRAPNETLVGSFGYADIGAISAPAGMAQRFNDAAANQPGQRTNSEVADQALASAGATGSRVVNLSQAVNSIGQLVALRPDATPPSLPLNLTSTGSTGNSVTLDWSASTDNVGVAGYTIYQGGNPIATTTTTTYSINGLVCGLNYPISVDAFDAAGNHSSQATVTVATTACPDTTPPSTPSGLVQTGSTDTSVNVSWNASSDDVGVAGYTVYQNGVQVATTTAANYSVNGLTCNSTYNLSIDAFDAAGNHSGQTSMSVSSSNCPDTTPPSVSITGPSDGSAASGTQVTITANASDDTSVSSVQFEIDGTVLGSPLTTGPYAVNWDTTSVSNGTHTLTALATDSAGNSTTSAPVTVAINNNPVVDSVNINQATPSTNDLLSATVTAHDPAGSNLTYTYQWLKNGSVIPDATSPTLDLSQAGNGNKGDTISLQVIASDGTYTSSPATSDTVTIINSVPSSTVSLSSATPDTDATITATAAVSDTDGDPISLTYDWSVNGVVTHTVTTTSLSNTFDLSMPGNGNYGDNITVTVTPNDGTINGSSISASAVVTKPNTGTILEYSLPVQAIPSGITKGPDGNLWFSLEQSSYVGRISPSGGFKLYSLPATGNEGGINPGPDGNVWFTENTANMVSNINPTTGAITRYSLGTTSVGVGGIVAGADGNMWILESNANKIGRVTPTGSITLFTSPTASSLPHGLNPGPDGNIWFNEFNGNKIARITPSGLITEFKLPTAAAKPDVIVAGPDGNMWFTEDIGKIGRITMNGIITEFSLPNSSAWPVGIATGPDGNLWFTEKTAGKIGRITPSGIITEFPLPVSTSQPDKIVLGPDGNLWFTEHNGNKIGRVTP